MKNLKFPAESKSVAKPKLVPPQPSGPDLRSDAEEYLANKYQAEQIEKRMKVLRDRLEPALERLPGMKFVVGEKMLVLTPVRREAFDLEAAKKKLGKKLEPYTEIIEKFDLEAAKKHLDEKQLKPFITAKESYALRTPDTKED